MAMAMATADMLDPIKMQSRLMDRVMLNQMQRWPMTLPRAADALAIRIRPMSTAMASSVSSLTDSHCHGACHLLGAPIRIRKRTATPSTNASDALPNAKVASSVNLMSLNFAAMTGTTGTLAVAELLVISDPKTIEPRIIQLWESSSRLKE